MLRRYGMLAGASDHELARWQQWKSPNTTWPSTRRFRSCGSFSRQPPGRIGHPVARIDWIGRPEQTNVRLNNPGLSDADDIRDLWNQQKPFEISKELQPLFLQRLKDSFADWDMRDGKADWKPEALAANANVFLDDFLLFDVAKPITDQSHLEIEKSTIDGRPYQTGGGRTVDANSIDILLTWLINHDREFLQGGATGATKPGMEVFPYFAPPNTELQTVSESVALAAMTSSSRSTLAEICTTQGQARDAEALLAPVLSSRDPEARWRLADALIAQERFEEAKTQLDDARIGYEELLGKHLLAFADHAAEFYAGSGNDHQRALELARVSVAIVRPVGRSNSWRRSVANADEA
jgi:Tetratricopeptide repeat